MRGITNTIDFNGKRIRRAIRKDNEMNSYIIVNNTKVLVEYSHDEPIHKNGYKSHLTHQIYKALTAMPDKVIKPKIRDIVVIVGSQSIFTQFLGRYGIIKDIAFGKYTIEFCCRIDDKGSLSHTAIEEDIKVIGTLNDEVKI